MSLFISLEHIYGCIKYTTDTESNQGSTVYVS